MSAPKRVSFGDAMLGVVLKLEAGWLWLITVFMTTEPRDRYREERHSHLLDHLQDDQERGRGPLKSAFGISLRFLAGMAADVAACARQSLPDGKLKERLSTRAILYALAIPSVVVGVDLLFLRHRLWGRLVANVAIVLVFTAIYLRFLKRRTGWRGSA